MLIDQVEALSADDYTADSWQALQDKLSEAKAIFESDTATQDEVNAITTQLRAAKNALVEADDPAGPSDTSDPDNSDGSENSGDTGNTQTQEPAGGCSGTALGSGAAGALALIGAAAIVLSRRKKQD